ncbi:right-handed parallel beta-helix repeat-containing protein [Ancylobacter oerskovii]|uniref:Right-handed parallel beta-helix repeat-containing protein n=1 Tax=Ancylobacter oerskovii TaxID=459519 RepID=A0ABW4YZI6_9HYPH|nr:right-handed parallel beta-helix repeat-containing protein [Ancylobacter oerskovii]MBS7542995.1 hypothetical protein [Ancylobacter oerskovii]
MDAYFPTLADARNALPDSPLPGRIRIGGRFAFGDGGETLFALQSSTLPIDGDEILTNGNFATDPSLDWYLSGWTWQGTPPDHLGPNSGEKKLSSQALALEAFKSYRLRFDISGREAGSWTAYVVSNANIAGSPHGGEARVVGTSGSGDGNIVFTAQPGENQIRIVGSTYFDGRLDDISLKEFLEQGQQILMGATYLPVPLDGVLRPDMFRGRYDTGGTEANDDNAMTRLVKRINTLMDPNAPLLTRLRVEMPGRYVCVLPGLRIRIPQDADLEIDGLGSGVVDLSGSSYVTTLPWLTVTGPGYDGVTRTTLKAEALQNTTALSVVDNDGFASGGWVAVTSTWDYFNGISGESGFGVQYKGELIQIRNPNSQPDLMAAATPLSHGYPISGGTVNVRKIALAGHFVLAGLRGVGPGHGELEEDQGTSFLAIRFFTHVRDEHTGVENFPGSSIGYTLCASLSLDTPKTVGRKLSDTTNTNPTSPWFYGRSIGGCSRASIVSPIGEYCRRAIDLGAASVAGWADDASSLSEAVISQNIMITGGYSMACFTQPGGHQSYNVELVGHIGRQISGGQIRGKNVRWVAVDLDCGAGTGISGNDDPSAYTEDPSSGTVELVNCSFRAQGDTDAGLVAHQSFDRLVVRGCTIVGGQPVRFFGRHQSNVEISGCDITGLTTTSPIIAGNIPTKTDGSNWVIRGNRLKNGTIAVLHAGAAGELVKNIRVLDNEFENIGTAHLSLNAAATGGWSSAGDLELVDNVERGTLPAIKADVGALKLVAFGNNFGDQAFPVSVSGSSIAVSTSRAAVVRAAAGLTANANVTTISGVRDGQLLVLSRDASAFTLTLTDNTGNLRMTGNLTLDTAEDRATFVMSGGLLYLVSFTNNA